MANSEVLEKIEELLQQGQVAEAEHALGPALLAAPEDADLLCAQARLLGIQGELQAGVSLLDRVLAAAPAHLPARVYKGALLVELREDEAATELLSQVVAEAPRHATANYNLARLRARLGDFTEADRLLGVAIEEEPGHPYYLFAKARVRADLGDIEGAFDWLSKTVKAEPGFVEAWAVLTQLQLQAGQYEDARKNLDTALSLSPDALLLHDLSVTARLASGDVSGAIEAAEVVAKAQPDNPDSQVNLGSCLLAAERFDDAEAIFRATLTNAPEHPRTLFALATLLESTGETSAVSEAIGLLERAIKAEPSAYQPYCELGRILITSEAHLDLDKAETVLEEAVTRAGGLGAEPLLNFALLKAKRGDESAALASLDALRTHPAASAPLLEQAEELAALIRTA